MIGRPIAIAVLVMLLLTGCLHTDEVSLGDDAPADLLIILVEDATLEDEAAVNEEVTKGAPIAGRSGRPLADGVRLVMASRVEDRPAIAVGFMPDATAEQRAAVHRAAAAHPAVDRVLFDTAPAEARLD